MKIKKGEKIVVTHKETGETDAFVAFSDVDLEKQHIDFRDENGDMQFLSPKDYKIVVMSEEDAKSYEEIDSFAKLTGVLKPNRT